jgi:hypothetical protein
MTSEHPVDPRIMATLTADGNETILVIEQRGLRLDWLAAFAAGLQIHVAVSGPSSFRPAVS